MSCFVYVVTIIVVGANIGSHDKGNQIVFGAFKVFQCMICSQRDGYHVGLILQGFAHCEKLGEMKECNLVGI
jgi:hypothetical protein